MEPYVYGALIGLACRAFNKVLGDADVAKKVEPILNPPPPEPPKLSGEPLRLLALLQREGRLLDFLLEDISAATDQQIGAGVREVHKKARAVLQEHLTLEPVLPGEEEANVRVPAGFDPSAVCARVPQFCPPDGGTTLPRDGGLDAGAAGGDASAGDASQSDASVSADPDAGDAGDASAPADGGEADAGG